jgi:hypothetical protein
MNRYRLLLAILIAVLLAGCGNSPRATAPTTTITSPAPFACHPKVPTPAGECVRQQLEAEDKTPARPLLTLTGRAPAPLCVDVSVWNGVPNFGAARVRCVIIQTNDGQVRNGLFAAQVAAAKRAGIPWGVYTYMAPYEAAGPQFSIALSMSGGQGRTLGVWADAEQTGAYEHACSYTADARAHGVHIYGVYSSPGIYTGGHCDGYAWPAEWGGGIAYPLGGYPSSAIILRQNCGTCRLSGFAGEVDRDEALGILGLAKPPAPKPPAPKPNRTRLIAEREALRRDLTRRRCRVAPYHGRGRYHALCSRWLHEGAVVDRQLV